MIVPAPDAARRATLRSLIGAALALGEGRDALADSADEPRAGDWLVSAADGAHTHPLRAADLPVGGPQTMAWAWDRGAGRARAASRAQRILLIRLDPTAMDEATRARAAGGVLAYSALCTHGECFVGEWRPARGALLCACHFSFFLPLRGAAVAGGPAREPLPWLPLQADAQGRLVLAGGFSAPPGLR